MNGENVWIAVILLSPIYFWVLRKIGFLKSGGGSTRSEHPDTGGYLEVLGEWDKD